MYVVLVVVIALLFGACCPNGNVHGKCMVSSVGDNVDGIVLGRVDTLVATRKTCQLRAGRRVRT